MVRTALLLCNGDPPSRALARRLARHADWIVAADGGADAARASGLTPDVIIGDLDSLSGATRRMFSSSLVLQLSRQDNTDLEKALDFLAASRVRTVTILGAVGKRVDFTLGNFSVLWKYSSLLDLRFAGEGWYAVPVGKKRIVRARRGTTVSLIPFGPCEGITLRGLQYTLFNASMGVGETGLSNVVVDSPFTVRVRRGAMLLLVQQEPR
jgi:thiamine pyrophosphokinase